MNLHDSPALHGPPIPPKLAAARLARATIKGDFKSEALHEYTDVDGAPLYWRLRARLADGSKWIRPMQRTGMQYSLSEPEFEKKPLYRLHELSKADPSLPVWFVEGEKCADALAKLGLLATTAGGAQSDEKADCEAIRNHRMILWADNDAPGKAHMQRASELFHGIGCTAESIDIEAIGLPEHGDVVDWLAGHPNATAGDLTALPRLSSPLVSVSPASAPISESEQPDKHRNAPCPDAACLYGLVGDVARAGSATTEANAFAVALNFIAYLGAAVGRGCYMPVGNTWHHPRVFTLHVGRSSRGRKGDAVSLPHRIDKALRAKEPYLAPQVHAGGLSSREGMVLLIHDGFKEGKNEVEPVIDKRLWIVESEFANVLHQAKRDGNTLSAALRDAWDGKTIKPATKTFRIGATDPHIGLSAAITPTELRDLIERRELSNGFANRFLLIWSERDKVMPFPKATPQREVDALADRVIEVLKFAGADRPVDVDKQRITLSTAAQGLYARLYRNELNAPEGGALVTSLIERRAPILLRLAMIFALSDLRHEVDVPHIEAALAWVRYWSDSARFVFASADDEAQAAQVNETAKRILAFLKTRRSSATRTEISRDCLSGHSSSDEIDSALDELLTASPPAIVVESVPRPKGNPGAPTKFYKLAANCAKSANSEDSCGSSGELADANSCEMSELSSTSIRTVRTVRNGSECPETRADTHVSHNSHISHGSKENAAPVRETF